MKKIIHIDMDYFFAQVEIRDNPSLKDKPVAIGGDPKGRGVLSTCNYIARKYGVKSAMPTYKALQLCPDLVLVNSHFDKYRKASEEVFSIFYEFTDKIEGVSLDEAYLDVTDCPLFFNSATLIAKEIRSRIFNKTGLTASAGVSYNKLLAKIGSEINKPNGQYVIPPDLTYEQCKSWSIRKINGVGKVTAAKMHNKGIFTGLDLKQKSLEDLTTFFGKSGKHYYQIVRGIHYSAVKPDRIRKSIAAERTFNENLSSEIFMLERLDKIANELERRMLKSNTKGKTVTLKIKYSDFTQQTRSKTIIHFISKKNEFMPVVKELLFQEKLKNSVRLLGISFSNLDSEKKEPFWVQLEFDF